MFKQLYLFELIHELASENIYSYFCIVPIHEYIQNKFLTCSCEVGDPILSQNIDRKYVVPKAKQEKKCGNTREDVLRASASFILG